MLCACGRIGFTETPDSALNRELNIVGVRPSWLATSGGPIEIDLDREVDVAEVTVDGQSCTNATSAGATISCDAPAHAPAVVGISLRSDALSASYYNLVYLTAGPYQYGAGASDRTSGVAIDRRGNVYVSGGTDGSLGGPNAGDFDAVLLKYDAAGQVAWIRQLGSPAFDYARDVAVDPVTQSPTVIGYTAGMLGAAPNAGNNDVFAARYTPDGDLVWLTQTGTPVDDQAWDLAIDASGATVAAVRTRGSLGAFTAGGEDYAVIHYTAEGMVDWIRQAGTTADDTGHSIAMAPDGTSYLVGYTTGDVAMPSAGMLDLFVAQYGADGTPGWIRQRGTAAIDEALDATVDASGDVWVAGRTAGALDGQTSGGGDDVFAMRFSADGTWLHTRQYGGTSNEVTFGIGVSPTGSVYIACNTSAAFAGQSAVGAQDICVVAADRAGNQQWTRILGSLQTDAASSCAVDAGLTGFVYVSAITNGSLDGQPNRGIEDIAVVKLDATGAVR